MKDSKEEQEVIEEITRKSKIPTLKQNKKLDYCDTILMSLVPTFMFHKDNDGTMWGVVHDSKITSDNPTSMVRYLDSKAARRELKNKGFNKKKIEEMIYIGQSRHFPIVFASIREHGKEDFQLITAVIDMNTNSLIKGQL